jgi:hypothetical protein
MSTPAESSDRTSIGACSWQMTELVHGIGIGQVVFPGTTIKAHPADRTQSPGIDSAAQTMTDHPKTRPGAAGVVFVGVSGMPTVAAFRTQRDGLEVGVAAGQGDRPWYAGLRPSLPGERPADVGAGRLTAGGGGA